MNRQFRFLLVGRWTALSFLLFLAVFARSAESASAPKKIVLIAGKKSHGPGEHDYEKGVKLLRQCLDTSPNAPRIKTEVCLDGWPQNAATLEDAATILFYCDGSDRDEKAHPLLTDNRLETMGRLMKRGVGLMAIHYAVFVPSKRGGEQFLDWIGGYFDYENGSAPNKWFSKIETKTYRVMPSSAEHALTRGVKPFEVREEFYFNMRVRDQDAHWKPVLTFAPERADSTAVVAWSIERADGGRGFAYTGGHFHKNWENEDVRKLILNALLWTAKIGVPAGGVESTIRAGSP